jgi:predicted DNA-binding protein (MmcQ/YjbR family)
MDSQRLLDHCLAKPGAWPDQPWEDDTVVKVADRIFAFLGGPDSDSVGLKCGSRDEADGLIARYPDDVSVMAYLGRYGWNSVRLAGEVPDDEILELVDESYDYVVNRLPRSKRPSAG